MRRIKKILKKNKKNEKGIKKSCTFAFPNRKVEGYVFWRRLGCSLTDWR